MKTLLTLKQLIIHLKSYLNFHPVNDRHKRYLTELKVMSLSLTGEEKNIVIIIRKEK